MPSYYRFPFFLLLAFALFEAGRVEAQCTNMLPGQVLNINGCGKVFVDYSSNFTLRVPSDNQLDGIAVETEVLVEYELSGELNCGLEVIEITCIEITSLPPGVCDPDFSYTESFDAVPTVAFEPLIVNTDLEYHWDFGDQTFSDEILPEHTYSEQGTYEVCLTINGANCSYETLCKTLDLHECHAAFSHDTSEDGVVQFFNFSEGNYTQWEWKMGDGTIVTNEEVTEHEYNGVDIYTVCLTVWNDNGCSNEYCDYVFTGSGDVCEFSDCVLPGDTDVDEKANVYDLLPIGVAYGTEGPPRSLSEVSISMAWEPQYSPDWGLETIAGIDYKHIDCNGDGIIEDADLEAIEQNYEEPGSIFQVTAYGQPYFWLEFDWDTVVVTDNTPAFIELEADLMAGLPSLPFDDLRGFALQMDYPEDLVYEGGGVEIDYNDNSFFGSSNDILWMEHERPAPGVMDVGFARKNAFGTGFGKVADVTFIVIADVIPRASTHPFEVDLNGVLAVNQSGAQLTLDQPDEPATVIIVNKTTTDTKVEILNQKVNVFPNPANDMVWLSLGDLSGERVEIFNSLGQKVGEHGFSISPFQLDVSGFAEGVYHLHVHTDEGVAKKRLVVD